jgi:hypothetical protein
MFGRTIVVWLVLLVVALNVVAFVTRMMEKRRPDDPVAAPSKITVSALRSNELSILKHQQERSSR